MQKFLVSALALCGFGAVASAASLDLSYVKTAQGALWQYTFTLGVDTSVSGWSAGMGWDWFIFGDANGTTSPMADFTMTSSFPVGPWTSLSSSGGGHNGPTFAPVVGADWIPTSANDTLTWTGTSSFNASPGTLLFSELVVDGGATADNFKPATQAAPEPASVLALGFVAVLFLRRRRSSK